MLLQDFTSLTGITIDTMEYVYLTHKQQGSSSSFHVRHPKIAPFLSGDPKSTTVGYNSEIFANDTKVKPQPAKTFSMQNYITIPRSTNCSLSHLEDINGYIAAGTRLVVRCHNSNMREMTIVDG